MKIKKLRIENLRGLSDVNFVFDQPTNVIVGPNAIGKTTILEAIRLVKCLLMPRYFQEGQQVLVSLGAMSPHPQLNNYLEFSSLTRDETIPIKIQMDLELNGDELNYLSISSQQLGLEILKGQMGRNEDQNQLALTQFLSSEEGKKRLDEAARQIDSNLSKFVAPFTLPICLTIDPAGGIRGENQLNQAMVILLERRHPPHKALFSYFPADRAFPAGETVVQIGSNEANSQIQAHMGQASTKYQRLKQTIVNNLLLSGVNENELHKDFASVFAKLLPGKELAGISVTPVGTLKVAIREQSSNKVFDIDGMSSGEKGLILTFMLLFQTLASGGIALLDEPELHLNPAVCKNIISFISEEIIQKNDIQVLLCTHSGEILGTAFDREDCTVHHLRSHNDATKIYEKDSHEVFCALARLGTSAADSMFSQGNIFVEGDHDSLVLEDGFYEFVSGYKITSLGGRTGIEKEITTLQQAEKKGDLDKLNCFIFDLDRMPSSIVSTPLVKVLQWDRYCLENYLIKPKELFDELTELGVTDLDSRGIFEKRLKEMALQQLSEVVAREVYAKESPESVGVRSKDIEGKSFAEMAEILSDRLNTLKLEIQNHDNSNWKNTFIDTCNTKHAELLPIWEDNWFKQASGKRLIDDLYKEYKISIAKLTLKRRLAKRLKADKTEDWTLVKSKILDALTH
ncbi:MAG: AAA family ATPase [Methylobacter sp.]|jgi:AAA15 family ATPase/GTPase|uniref:ATP-dependent nuclease n=1 Tax=Methylobacter sp. TaxID=2051955 RepID=UPI0026010187|nr:AAA family ATPase [Methylobacter sp.]MCK9621590.1 AAA family ATPase [Methylobacter sp.]